MPTHRWRSGSQVRVAHDQILLQLTSQSATEPSLWPVEHAVGRCSPTASDLYSWPVATHVVSWMRRAECARLAVGLMSPARPGDAEFVLVAHVPQRSAWACWKRRQASALPQASWPSGPQLDRSGRRSAIGHRSSAVPDIDRQASPSTHVARFARSIGLPMRTRCPAPVSRCRASGARCAGSGATSDLGVRTSYVTEPTMSSPRPASDDGQRRVQFIEGTRAQCPNRLRSSSEQAGSFVLAASGSHRSVICVRISTRRAGGMDCGSAFVRHSLIRNRTVSSILGLVAHSAVTCSRCTLIGQIARATVPVGPTQTS